jgi:AcrR family transcriptional regulator
MSGVLREPAISSAASGAPARHRTTPAEGAETRSKLISIARALFAAKGHSAVSTAEICEQANVTRGALYHHFPGKDGLFRAVCEQVADDVTGHVVEVARSGPDAWTRVRLGCRAFLDACAGEDVRRILLTDAPSVLGWATFREMDDRHALGLLRITLGAAMDEGAVARGDPDMLAHVLVAALNEAALVVGRSLDGGAMLAATSAIDRLLDGIAGGGEATSAPG